MFDRFKTALSAFRHVWKHYNPETPWTKTFNVWMRDSQEFKIGDFQFIDGKPYRDTGRVMPNGLEPFMLKKLCRGPNGDVRYFDVVPEGYERVEH